MRQRIDKIVGTVLISLMVLMTLDVLWGVATRYLFGNQASWTEELARFLLIWIGILGAAFTSGQNLHLAIDLFSSASGASWKSKRIFLIKGSVILFALFVLIVGGSRLIYISHVLGQTSPALGLPMTLIYAVIPISGCLIVYYKWDELKSGLRHKASSLHTISNK